MVLLLALWHCSTNVFASVLDVPTALQLMDISVQTILCYNLFDQCAWHLPTLTQVSNLAEQAADAIGADRLLVRVGTLYHDAGKVENLASSLKIR